MGNDIHIRDLTSHAVNEHVKETFEVGKESQLRNGFRYIFSKDSGGIDWL